jgi:hypothetical protein
MRGSETAALLSGSGVAARGAALSPGSAMPCWGWLCGAEAAGGAACSQGESGAQAAAGADGGARAAELGLLRGPSASSEAGSCPLCMSW